MSRSRGDEEGPFASDERAFRSARSEARGAREASVAGHAMAAAPLRFLLRVAIAIATVVLFGGSVGHVQASASLVASTFRVAARVHVEPGAVSVESSHHWQDRAPRHPPPDLKAVELDDDDDDDPARDVPDLAAHSSRGVVDPCAPGRALRRGELQVDTSRFAAGTGLPRGPPA